MVKKDIFPVIYLAADHRGFAVKEKVKKWLEKKGKSVVDLSGQYQPGDDYPDHALAMARSLKKKGGGVLFCGSGVGVDMAANRFSWVRCGLGFDEEQVVSARSDDNINCLAIAADYLSFSKIKKLVEAFLKTPFKKKFSYQRRLMKLFFLKNIK